MGFVRVRAAASCDLIVLGDFSILVSNFDTTCYALPILYKLFFGLSD